MKYEPDTTRNCVYRARNIHDALREFLRLKHRLQQATLSGTERAQLLAQSDHLEKLLCKAIARNLRILALDTKESAFPIGTLVQTGGSREVLGIADVSQAVARHMRRDWGGCSPEDKLANDRALEEGGKLLSMYQTSDGVKFWVVTEADRSVTTVLLPCEY